MDLPNLWRPKPDHFFRLEALPMLGTGKLDLRGMRAKAVELLRNEPMDHSPSGHQPYG
jgi:acyl-[acyl-carrier-protein]-phospholipid O-acyltransferase / long-chain-fatty-acid--[acyl-carrier-protein] ligase